MQLESINEQEFKNRIREILCKYLDLSRYAVFVFGSRVRGNATQRSDIDIGLDGSERIPGDIMENIKDELEDLPYMQKVDIVDMKTITPNKQRVMRQYTESLQL